MIWMEIKRLLLDVLQNWADKEVPNDDGTDKVLGGFFKYLTCNSGGALYKSEQAATSINRIEFIVQTLTETISGMVLF